MGTVIETVEEARAFTGTVDCFGVDWVMSSPMPAIACTVMPCLR